VAGCLQEHSPTGFEEAVGGVEHDRDQRGDAVSAAKPGGEDDGAGDGGEDERCEVGEDVGRNLDVHRLAVGLGQRVAGCEVDDDPDQGDDEDGGTAQG